MELPSHPDADDSGTDHKPAATSRAIVVFVAVVIALFAAMLILHLAGVVGPKAN